MKKALSICFSGAIACASVLGAQAGEVGVHPELLRELGKVADTFSAKNTKSPVSKIVLKRSDGSTTTLQPDANSEFGAETIAPCMDRFPDSAHRYELGGGTVLAVFCQVPGWNTQGNFKLRVDYYRVAEDSKNTLTQGLSYTKNCPIGRIEWEVFPQSVFDDLNNTLCVAPIAPGG